MSATALHSGKFLTFIVENEEYGIDALLVEGILSMQEITPVPNAQGSYKGVITVRGKVVPVISMRLALGMREVDVTSETCIILLTNRWGTTGVVVDTVRDVIDIGEEDIEPPPPMSSGPELMGLAKSGGKVRMLLNMEVITGVPEEQL